MTSLEPLFDLYARWGSGTYDEVVTQTDHARQCAALARAAGASDALVAAALLHDVGHLLDLADGGGPRPGADLRHEDRGAVYLATWFGPEVTEPVRLHVVAKRYLCAVEPAYAAGLSAGSRRSLAVQGGPLDAGAAADFAGTPGAGAAVALRRWDDAGKVAGLERPAFGSYRDLLGGLTPT